MNIMLTGGTGFLGSYVLKNLLERNHVIVLKRSSSDIGRITKYLGRENCEAIDIDLVDVHMIVKDKEPEIIIHTATSYGRNGNMDEVEDSNLKFPLKLLFAAIKCDSKAFINTDTFFNERMGLETRNGGYSSASHAYVRTKKQFVRKAKKIINGKSLKFVNLVVAQLYGPNDNSQKFTPFIINSLREGVSVIPLTPGEHTRDFIFVEDVSRAYVSTVDYISSLKPYEEFEIGWGKEIKLREFVEEIKKQIQNNSHLDWGALPYRENEIMRHCADISNNSKINWKPRIGLTEGIRKTIVANIS